MNHGNRPRRLDHGGGLAAIALIAAFAITRRRKLEGAVAFDDDAARQLGLKRSLDDHRRRVTEKEVWG